LDEQETTDFPPAAYV